nr:hypothetical protein [Butyrivibrio sp.]
EDLQLERDKALDNNDLAGAKLLDAKIQAVDNDIADEEDRLANILANSDSASEAARAGAELGNSLAGLSDKLVSKAADALQNDANADLSALANALADLGQTDALNDLKDLAQNSGASDDTLSGIQNALDSADSDGSGSGDGSGDGSGTGDGSEDGLGADSSLLSMSADELMDALLAFFGVKSLDELGMKESAIAAVAFSKIYKMGNNAAGELANTIATKGITDNNIYFYIQFNGTKTIEYASLKAVSDITSYRYFYDDTKKVATMTLGSTIYSFTTGSDQMYKGDTSSDPETMTRKLEFSGVPYLAEDDCVNYFKCDTEYIATSSYAVCYTNPMKAQVEEYISGLNGD